jgi:two-component system chemotaxis response regulator CheY
LAPGPEPSASPVPLRGRVLVVDDDRAIRDLLRDVLADDGYDVRAASNGLAALEVMGSWPPELIVLDMAMPVMDGKGFRAAQLANPEWRGIPVLVLSATAAYLSDDSTIGAKAVLGKPFEVDELLDLVRRWIVRRP